MVKYVLFTGTTAVEGTDYTLGDIAENEAGNNTVFGPQPLTNGLKVWQASRSLPMATLRVLRPCLT